MIDEKLHCIHLLWVHIMETDGVVADALLSLKERCRKVYKPGQEVIKLFLCSTHLNTKVQQLIKTKIPTNKEVPLFKSARCCIYHAHKLLAF